MAETSEAYLMQHHGKEGKGDGMPPHPPSETNRHFQTAETDTQEKTVIIAVSPSGAT